MLALSFEIPQYGSQASRLSRLSAAHPSEIMSSPPAVRYVHAQRFQRTDFDDDSTRDYQVYYCDAHNAVQGPFSQKQMRDWADRGQLDSATVCSWSSNFDAPDDVFTIGELAGQKIFRRKHLRKYPLSRARRSRSVYQLASFWRSCGHWQLKCSMKMQSVDVMCMIVNRWSIVQRFYRRIVRMYKETRLAHCWKMRIDQV